MTVSDDEAQGRAAMALLGLPATSVQAGIPARIPADGVQLFAGYIWVSRHYLLPPLGTNMLRLRRQQLSAIA